MKAASTDFGRKAQCNGNSYVRWVLRRQYSVYWLCIQLAASQGPDTRTQYCCSTMPKGRAIRILFRQFMP